MLVLTREVGQTIQVGPDITIMLVEVKGSYGARIGIEAPLSVEILRPDAVCKTPTKRRQAAENMKGRGDEWPNTENVG